MLPPVINGKFSNMFKIETLPEPVTASSPPMPSKRVALTYNGEAVKGVKSITLEPIFSGNVVVAEIEFIIDEIDLDVDHVVMCESTFKAAALHHGYTLFKNREPQE